MASFERGLILVGTEHGSGIQVRVGRQRKDPIHHLRFRDRLLVARAADSRHPAYDFAVHRVARSAAARDLPEFLLLLGLLLPSGSANPRNRTITVAIFSSRSFQSR